MELHGLLFEAIFEHALDLPPGDAREAYVAEICGDDVDLRARVDAFLEAEERICPVGPCRTAGPELRVTPETWPQVEPDGTTRAPSPVELHRILAEREPSASSGRLRSA